ncbi:ferredoxin [Micromonospora sp. NPDC000089]|uniref:ferredoxin n=1 Tax=unclassified Micromonospora TaxID=2617518 RepID=UPI0036C5C6EA
MHVQVDPDACIGSGQCAMAVPEIFDQDDDGIVLVRRSRVAVALHDAAQEAAERCPVQAITLNGQSDPAERSYSDEAEQLR